MDLGDAWAEQQREFRVIHDDVLNAHLQEIGDRILAQLPPSGMQIRFRLVDVPILNAWTIPGGRIYVTRKMVAWANSDDELAALLAHELGHSLTHQPAIQMSEVFRQVLGATSVGDRADIFNKFHEFQEKHTKRPTYTFKEEEQEQYIADRVALYALARAGYSPQTFGNFFDRLAATQGKTGGWLSDLFGTTKPNERRLREIRRSLAEMPQSCLIASRAETPSEAFKAWQKAVIEHNGLRGTAEIPGLVWKRTLDPPLQSDFTEVKFSPDGRWLLAKDDSSIDVLSREPLVAVFRIPAPNAHKARFTPDSKSIVFLTWDLRVEKWSIAEKKRAEVHEVVMRDGCLQTLLSPDGNSLACFTPMMGIELLDVDSGTVYFEKKEFYQPIRGEFRLWLAAAAITGSMQPMNMDFSPDNRYFVAGRRYSILAVDLSSRKTIPLPSRFHDLIGTGFTFVAPDRIVAISGFDPRESEEATFPEGHTITKLMLAGRLSAAGHGDYVIVRPVEKHPVGAVDIKTGKVFLASQEPALDVYDGVYARGRLDGTVAVFDVATHKELASTKLPPGEIVSPRAGAVSADLKWVALSGRSRGAVWDLTNGNRVFHVRGFHGAWFDKDDQLFADFPEIETPVKAKRMVNLLDPIHKQALQGSEITVTHTTQYGSVLASMHNEDDKKGEFGLYNADLDVSDVATGKILWSKNLPGHAPFMTVTAGSDRLALIWPPLSKTGLDELEQNAPAKNRSQHKDDEGVVEVFELHSGKTVGILPIQMAGAARILPALVTAGDWVVIGDARNRIMIYSISGAQPERRLFGHRPVISGDGNFLCLENEIGQVEIYDLKSLQKQEELNFTKSVAMMQFVAASKNIFVVTADQNAYLVDLSATNDLKPQEAKK